jgi:HEPN domain-containing protein
MSYLSTYAQDFLNSYQILKESNDALVNRLADGEGNERATSAFGTLPAMGIEIVCLAFSVELHLKELHRVVSNEILKGHDIRKLFSALPADVRKDIASHRAIAQYGWDSAQFDLELKAISDGFEKWRYAYESTTLKYNSYFAESLIRASQFVSSTRDHQ